MLLSKRLLTVAQHIPTTKKMRKAQRAAIKRVTAAARKMSP